MIYTVSKLSENMHITPDGFLLCLNVPITRTGELVYGEGETPLETDAEGKILIYRDADDVFHADTMASFEGKPITVNHPEDFVSPDNFNYLVKGTVQNVRAGTGEFADSLICDLLIMDATAIALVKNGLREVSCGYEAEYTQLGVGKGKQTKIIGNHVALVERGRAGREHRINDHERKVTRMSKLKEKLLNIMGKTIDEEMKEKEAPAKDDATTMPDSTSEMMAVLKAIAAKIGAVAPQGAINQGEAPGKDDAEKKPEVKKDEPAKDDGEEAPAEMSTAEMSAAIKQLQTTLTKILEKLGDDDSEEDESDEDETDDEESEDSIFEDEESDEDDKKDAKKKSKSSDSESASRAEILSPGINTKSKTLKVDALKAAYATKEGKDAILKLNGNKAPAYDSAEKVDQLFIAASELLKAKRTKGLSDTKRVTDSDLEEHSGKIMTPAMINEANKLRYSGQK